MQWDHFVQLDNAFAAIQRRMGTLDTMIQGSGLVVQTRSAEIEGTVAWAVNTDYFVEHGGPHIEESKSLGLEDR
jgi:hypothetical protein